MIYNLICIYPPFGKHIIKGPCHDHDDVEMECHMLPDIFQVNMLTCHGYILLKYYAWHQSQNTKQQISMTTFGPSVMNKTMLTLWQISCLYQIHA